MPTVFSSHCEQIEDVQLYKLFVYFNHVGTWWNLRGSDGNNKQRLSAL